MLLTLQEISSEITEKLESLRGSFNTDIRKEYNMIMGKLGKTANVQVTFKHFSFVVELILCSVGIGFTSWRKKQGLIYV